MVVYRVFGLETFSDLFPNLTRIRGNTLVYNYALIVYDLPNLREVCEVLNKLYLRQFKSKCEGCGFDVKSDFFLIW